MIRPSFDYVSPKTLSKAVAVLEQKEPQKYMQAESSPM